MGSRTPQHKDIDPRLLAHDRLQRPYIPGPPILPDPNNPPSPVDDGPSEIDNADTLFRQGVVEAARGCLQSLPPDLQRQLPQDPVQAFRRIVLNPDAVPAQYRYDTIQSAERTATGWIAGVPAGIRHRLHHNPLRAFQAVILHLPVAQHPPALAAQHIPAPGAQPNTTIAPHPNQQPPIANQVLQEQQERLPQGIQAGAPHYGLVPRAPQVPPAPEAVVPRTSGNHSMDTTETPKDTYKRETK
ncbi:hypothetical protein H2200_011525 [Cladophialophora chaetospira]|uniref:Uncharacterized protein n=1 Tax=Cladophialophora chaetospira TaxID=386627 RepID=A0AA38WZJ9_9EURO|nr:hypothetical protein H2200_011525 [Cladophialophora chaetospira]